MSPSTPPPATSTTPQKKPLTPHQARKLDPSTSSKPCDICHTLSDVLIRCQKDSSEKWFLLCPGKCWMEASGGVVDGAQGKVHYRYGGVWKNKKGAVSGKKPKGKYNKPKPGEAGKVVDERSQGDVAEDDEEGDEDAGSIQEDGDSD